MQMARGGAQRINNACHDRTDLANGNAVGRHVGDGVDDVLHDSSSPAPSAAESQKKETVNCGGKGRLSRGRRHLGSGSVPGV
jgi:hypothetical protein